MTESEKTMIEKLILDVREEILESRKESLRGDVLLKQMIDTQKSLIDNLTEQIKNLQGRVFAVESYVVESTELESRVKNLEYRSGPSLQ